MSYAKYELIDSTDFSLVGAYDDFSEIERVLKDDLEHNGPDSVKELALMIVESEDSETIVPGDKLLEIAQKLSLPRRAAS